MKRGEKPRDGDAARAALAAERAPDVGTEFAALRKLRRLAKYRRTWAYRKDNQRTWGRR